MSGVEQGSETITAQHCPSCDRPMTGIKDYPLVEVSSIELIPLPDEVRGFSNGDITEMVRGIVDSSEVQEYLRFLDELDVTEGSPIPMETLLPTFEEDGYFKNAYYIPGSRGAYLGMSEIEQKDGNGINRVSAVSLWINGPNFGSAGGPTLAQVANLAKITYQGKFL